jgi:hypothetical protein
VVCIILIVNKLTQEKTSFLIQHLHGHYKFCRTATWSGVKKYAIDVSHKPVPSHYIRNSLKHKIQLTFLIYQMVTLVMKKLVYITRLPRRIARLMKMAKKQKIKLKSRKTLILSLTLILIKRMEMNRKRSNSMFLRRKTKLQLE